MTVTHKFPMPTVSSDLTPSAVLFSDKLIAEVEASKTVCNPHHAAHTQRHRP
jgi:hypothetical protein